MNNIFVIDKATKCNLGVLDFTPRKDDRISMKASEWKEIEVIVECVLYEPLEHATLTGYLTGDYKSAFNKGKQQEVEMRVSHKTFK